MPDEFLDSLAQAVGAFLESVADTSLFGFPTTTSGEVASALEKIADHPMELKGPDEHQGFARIKDFDPDFDIGEFLTRVGQMFAAAVLYWSVERPDRMRLRSIDSTASEGGDYGEEA